MRKNHRWSRENNAMICIHCSRSKRSVCYVGLFIFWTYLRADGIRFTGQAPSCGEGLEVAN